MYGKHVAKSDHRRPKRMARSKDRRVFAKTATRTEQLNTAHGSTVHRGGVRL